MHVHHADHRVSHSGWGCGRHGDDDVQISLRRKALLEVAATSTAQPANVGPGSVPAATAGMPSGPATDNTYDLAAMRRQKGSLSILTQDGDTVRIRFRTREAVAVQSTTGADGDGTSSTSVYAFASGRVQVAVNGELDEGELKAIGELMDKVDALASQFFDGDAQAAFAAAAELGFDAGEIAGFALRLSVKEYATASAAPPAPVAAPALPAPPPSVADPTPVTPTPEPAVQGQPAAADIAANTPVVADAAPQGTPAAAPPVPEAPAAADPAATVQQTLGNFLKQVLEGLSAVSGGGRAEFSMRWKLQVMIEAVQSAPAAATSDPAGTQLVTDSLARLAAAQA